MRINQLTIFNYKGFEKARFAFPEPFTVLTGPNGSGKTAILDALALAAGSYLQALDQRLSLMLGDYITAAAFGSNNERTPELDVKGLINNITVEWECILVPRSSYIVSRDERPLNTFKTQSNIRPLIAYYGLGRFLRHQPRRFPIEVQDKNSAILDAYSDCLLPLMAPNPSISWDRLYNRLQHSGYPLSSRHLDQLKDVFASTLRKISPYFRFLFDNDEELVIGYEQPDKPPQMLPLRLFPDGERGLICLIADLIHRCFLLNPQLAPNEIMKVPGLVLVDGLELHLHPSRQKDLVGKLQEIFPSFQFVVTTQSPFILQSLQQRQLIDLNQNALDTDPFRLSTEDIADEIMNVPEVTRSKRFTNMIDVAEKYYQLAAEGRTSENDADTALLRSQLNEMEELYGTDPAFVALLRVKRNDAAEDNNLTAVA